MVTFAQAEFDVRCEWGMRGLINLARASNVVIIIDVLSFTTAVEIATSRGAVIFPYPLKDESAAAGYAKTLNAEVAGARKDGRFSLSPAWLRNIPAGHRLVLPSPNGAALSFAANHKIVLAACLRNATAVGRLASRLGGRVAVIPAGEHWAETGELRPCFEDLVGAGAVIASLPGGNRSPEAEAALAAFERFRSRLRESFQKCGSAKELIERGFAVDVDLAAEYDVSSNVPRLLDGAFVHDPSAPPCD